jgi:hypothetical protein
VYSRFIAFLDRENARVEDLEKRFARVVLRIEERDDHREQRLADLERAINLSIDVAMGGKR